MSAAPTTASAMRAVLTQERFSDPDWIYERKLDGIRCVAIRDGGPVKLLSRNDLSLNGRFPGVAAALDADPRTRFAVDGEVVAFEGAQTSFQALGHPGASTFYYVFDVLWLDGEDVRSRPLRERKALLRDALAFADPIRLNAYRNEAGEAMFEEACRKGWEGVIAKRADSVYTDAPLARLAEVQVPAGPGARDRRLHRAARLAHRARRAARRPLRRRGRAALRGQGRHRLRSRHAAATSASACARCTARTPRSPTHRASATPPGSSRSSSPSSASPSGRPPAACATRASSACASTSRPARSLARAA